jgi:hypothetical protein
VRSTPCTGKRGARVSRFSLKTKVVSFSQFGLETGGYGSSGLDSKPLMQVSRFESQTRQLWFGHLGHKISAAVSWFGPQNQVGHGLSVATQNQREDEYGMGHVSRCNGLLRLEATQARVSQSSIKTGRDVTRMVHVASSWMLCGDKAEDERVNVTGCIGFFYLNFIVFVVLAHKDSLVISFPKNRTLRAGREVSISAIPLPPPSYSCFLIGVDMLHVLEKRGEK